jgi:hypothetical protein
VKQRRRRSSRITITPHPKVMGHIDTLLATGLYGRSRSDLVKRLVCEGIVQRIGDPKFRLRATGWEDK